jgi:DNA-binding transcriptional regulator YdaS (Cro superfamily)
LPLTVCIGSLYSRPMTETPLDTVREKLGNLRDLAAALGVSRAAVYHWRRVPAERVLEVERISGVHRSELRPDLYPPSDYPPSS